MEVIEIQPWLFRVEPLESESFSHFLVRFRRANELTPTGLGKMAELGGAVARWEKFYLNPFPSGEQLAALAAVVGEKQRGYSSKCCRLQGGDEVGTDSVVWGVLCPVPLS